MAEPSASGAEQGACHVNQCAQPATYSCDRCGQAYCAEHVQSRSIERREDHADADNVLARLPTRIETYWLCQSCWKKPFSGKQPLETP
jgi:hypothetical protein